jgi:hypothetical protein
MIKWVILTLMFMAVVILASAINPLAAQPALVEATMAFAGFALATATTYSVG